MITYDIQTIVPAFIRNDHNGKAMMKAIDRCLQIFCDVCLDGIECVTDIDKMPEWRLNEYAWEMGAEWFDSTTTIDEKREQAKAIHDVYRKIGTKSAVEYAINAVFGDGNIIKEWHEYDGDPYHYYIRITSEDAVTERRKELLRIIDIVSNTRSVLENIYFSGSRGTTEVIHTETAVSGIDELVIAPEVIGYISGGRSPVLGRGVLGKMLIGKTK